MITISEAITEAQAEEMAEREVKKTMDNKQANNTIPANMVTISLEEYLGLYVSTNNYCKLLAIISSLVEPCTYSDSIRIKDDDEILDFIKFNEMDVYNEMLNHVNDLKKRGEDI